MVAALTAGAATLLILAFLFGLGDGSAEAEQPSPKPRHPQSRHPGTDRAALTAWGGTDRPPHLLSGSPVDTGLGEGGELCPVELVAALFLVGRPHPDAANVPIRHRLHTGPPRHTAFPRDVLLEGLKAFLEGRAARARPHRRGCSRRRLAGPWGLLHAEFAESALLLGVEPVPVPAL
ncbi:hypothetical protein [Streptomyces virginiae]